MNLIQTMFFVTLTQIVFCQSYDENITKAGDAIQKQDYCLAYSIFKQAFKKDTNRIAIYDLAYAAIAASNCNAMEDGLNWISKSQQMGLGLNAGEIEFLMSDPSFEKLRNNDIWNGMITKMKVALENKKSEHLKRKNDWLQSINRNVISPKKGKYFEIPISGFALYYSEIDGIKVPYLVYVPKNYKATKTAKVIVHLHGGVVSTEDFQFQNPDLATGEPIFSCAEEQNAIVIYPFGKKDFGWVDQPRAFENVLLVLAEVQRKYNINPKQIYLGGMSNGGTAAFWFASQRKSPIKAFYALSAFPKLAIGDIDFKKIKPFYMLNAIDDEVYSHKEILDIYEKERTKNWYYDTIEKGGHGFLYGPDGKDKLNSLLKRVIKK